MGADAVACWQEGASLSIATAMLPQERGRFVLAPSRRRFALQRRKEQTSTSLIHSSNTSRRPWPSPGHRQLHFLCSCPSLRPRSFPVRSLCIFSPSSLRICQFTIQQFLSSRPSSWLLCLLELEPPWSLLSYSHPHYWLNLSVTSQTAIKQTTLLRESFLRHAVHRLIPNTTFAVPEDGFV